MLDLVLDVCDREFDFEDFEKCRAFFKDLIKFRHDHAAALAADRMTINAVHSNRNFNIVRISFLY